MRVAIVGSRNCKNCSAQKINEYIPLKCTRIISGGASGVDTLAAECARMRDIPLENYLPQYKKYGKNALLLRNTQIVEASDLVLAFWDFTSKGTAHTIAECIRLRVPFRIVGI